MLSGRLNKRVTIQSPVITNVDGEPVTVWQDVATVWAGIEYLQGRELEYAQQLHELANVSILLRYSALASHQRIVYRETKFEIVGVTPDVKQRELRATAIASRITTLDVEASGGVALAGLADISVTVA